MQAKKVLLWCLFVFFLFGLIVGNVKARTEVFSVEPTQEFTRKLELTVSDSVSGNVSVEGGVIDFYVTNPTGSAVFYCSKIDKTDFKFTASENGNYTIHFVNSLSTTNVTVTMNYFIDFVITLYETINVDTVLDATTVAATLPPPQPPPRLRKPNLEDLYRTYLILREAENILNAVRIVWEYMPIQSIVGILSLAVLVRLCYGFARGKIHRLAILKARARCQ